MQPFRKHTGVVVLLDKVNVDTDQIIPKQFLKRIERLDSANSCLRLALLGGGKSTKKNGRFCA